MLITGGKAHVADVVFENWENAKPVGIYHSVLDGIKEYVPGSFYLREMPYILHILNEYCLVPDTIIVDGYVYLGDPHRPGLGAYLYTNVIGHPALNTIKAKPFSKLHTPTAYFI